MIPLTVKPLLNFVLFVGFILQTMLSLDSTHFTPFIILLLLVN